jgi:hypothetical protein
MEDIAKAELQIREMPGTQGQLQSATFASGRATRETCSSSPITGWGKADMRIEQISVQAGLLISAQAGYQCGGDDAGYHAGRDLQASMSHTLAQGSR